MPLPLEGLLVVSLEQAVAAPTCSCRPRRGGVRAARVIKIEQPEGDFARGYDDLARRAPISSGSTAARISSSSTLGPKTPDDKAFRTVLAKADVELHPERQAGR